MVQPRVLQARLDSRACEELVAVVRRAVDEWTAAHGGALDGQAENRTSAA